jgi:hypothetical protein
LGLEKSRNKRSEKYALRKREIFEKEKRLTQDHVRMVVGYENECRCCLRKALLGHHSPDGLSLGPRRLCRDYCLHTIGDDRCTRVVSAANNFGRREAVEGVLRHRVSQYPSLEIAVSGIQHEVVQKRMFENNRRDN